MDAEGVGYRERYAYTLGVQAYVYGFPWVYLPTLRYMWVTQPVDPVFTPYAPVNQFFHGRNLVDASYRMGGSPNNDTLYSIAWINAGAEPLILSVPELGDRYFTFEFAGMDSDNFAYVGTRTTGGGPGNYAIVGPGWSGDLPDDMVALEPSRTPWVLVFGRTLVDGPDDLDAVRAIQDQYRLTPLSAWGDPDFEPVADRNVWAPFDPTDDPLAEWKTMNRAMTENPPEARHEQLMKLFATIGVGPGCDIDTMDEATKAGLVRAAVDGRKLLHDAVMSGDLGAKINGWSFPDPMMGRAGLVDRFLLRSAQQCMGGIISNDPAEAVYANTTVDADGCPLEGSQRYTLTFRADQRPEVDGFWSLTAYGTDFCLVDNPIDRYAIGDRTPGLHYNDDESLTLYIQATSPGPEHEPNWLPIADEGRATLVLRCYLPGPSILNGTWDIPPVTTNT